MHAITNHFFIFVFVVIPHFTSAHIFPLFTHVEIKKQPGKIGSYKTLLWQKKKKRKNIKISKIKLNLLIPTWASIHEKKLFLYVIRAFTESLTDVGVKLDGTSSGQTIVALERYLRLARWHPCAKTPCQRFFAKSFKICKLFCGAFPRILCSDKSTFPEWTSARKFN